MAKENMFFYNDDRVTINKLNKKDLVSKLPVGVYKLDLSKQDIVLKPVDSEFIMLDTGEVGEIFNDVKDLYSKNNGVFVGFNAFKNDSSFNSIAGTFKTIFNMPVIIIDSVNKKNLVELFLDNISEAIVLFDKDIIERYRQDNDSGNDEKDFNTLLAIKNKHKKDNIIVMFDQYYPPAVNLIKPITQLYDSVYSLDPDIIQSTIISSLKDKINPTIFNKYGKFFSEVVDINISFFRDINRDPNIDLTGICKIFKDYGIDIPVKFIPTSFNYGGVEFINEIQYSDIFKSKINLAKTLYNWNIDSIFTHLVHEKFLLDKFFLAMEKKIHPKDIETEYEKFKKKLGRYDSIGMKKGSFSITSDKIVLNDEVITIYLYYDGNQTSNVINCPVIIKGKIKPIEIQSNKNIELIYDFSDNYPDYEDVNNIKTSLTSL